MYASRANHIFVKTSEYKNQSLVKFIPVPCGLQLLRDVKNGMMKSNPIYLYYNLSRYLRIIKSGLVDLIL